MGYVQKWAVTLSDSKASLRKIRTFTPPKPSIQDKINLKVNTCLFFVNTYLTLNYLERNKWSQYFFILAHQKVLKGTRRGDCLPENIFRVMYFSFIHSRKWDLYTYNERFVLYFISVTQIMLCVTIWTWQSRDYIFPDSFDGVLSLFSWQRIRGRIFHTKVIRRMLYYL